MKIPVRRLPYALLACALALAGAPVRPLHAEELADFLARQTRPITLNATDAEVGVLLKSIARTGEFDVVLASDAVAKISVRFTDVPVGVALARVLELGGIEASVTDGILLAYPKAGMRVFALQHAPAARVQDIVKPFLSGDGKTSIDAKTNTLIVHDKAEVLNQIQRMMVRLDRKPRQVNVEAAIISAKLDDVTNIGVNFEKFKFINRNKLQITTQGLAADVASGNKGIFLELASGQLMAVLEALQKTTDFKVLSHPRLQALSGEPAEIRVGERLGFLTSVTTVGTGTPGTTTQSVEFLDVGTSLKFTAHVTEDGSVELELKPEVSEGAIDAQGLPNKKTSEMTTRVKVKSGQTLLLGGLIRSREEVTVSKVPVLGSIPLLGALFRSRSVTQGSDEVIVMITPVVEPESAPAPASP